MNLRPLQLTSILFIIFNVIFGLINCKPVDFKNLFFLHVMKTGGSTFGKLIKQKAIHTNTLHSIYHNGLSSPELTWKVFSTERQNWTRITAFREPVSRVVSHYWQVKPSTTFVGGAHIGCRTAATSGFASYLDRCPYATNLQWTSIHKLGPTPEAALSHFDLVFVLEYYDYGVYLLHVLFHFEVDEILYLKLKDRNIRHVNTPDLILTDSMISSVVKKNSYDMEVYSAALKAFYILCNQAEEVLSSKTAQYRHVPYHVNSSIEADFPLLSSRVALFQARLVDYARFASRRCVRQFPKMIRHEDDEAHISCWRLFTSST